MFLKALLNITLILVGILHTPLFSQDIKKAELLYLRKEYARCIQVCKSIKSQNIDEALWLEGLSHLALGEYKEARSCFQKIIKKRSQLQEKAILGFIDSYLFEEKFKKAYSLYKKTSSKKLSPQTKELLKLRIARVCLKLGKWQEAKKYLKELQHSPYLLIRKEAEKLLNPDNFYFTLQVGSFINKDNAYKLLEELLKKNLPAYIQESKYKNVLFYRVKVGREKTRQQIQKLKDTLYKLGYPSTIRP